MLARWTRSCGVVRPTAQMRLLSGARLPALQPVPEGPKLVTMRMSKHVPATNLPTYGTRRPGENAEFKSLDTGLPKRLVYAIELRWGLEAHTRPDNQLSARGLEPRECGNGWHVDLATGGAQANAAPPSSAVSGAGRAADAVSSSSVSGDSWQGS